MTGNLSKARVVFRELHAGGCFLLPNPWDIGSAKLFAHLGFKALATTSTGLAWTLGKADYSLTMDEVLDHLKALSAATDLPVNADFESGFADSPEGVMANVTLAIDAGVAGLSIEDRVFHDTARLYEDTESAERIRAAKSAIEKSGKDVILVGRTERLLMEPTATSRSIDTLVALADAGADCLYAPGISGAETIAALVKAVAPKPVNVLTMGPHMPGLTFAQLRDLGVRRISVGGALSLVSWGATEAAAAQLLDGSFEPLAKGMPRADLNAIFAG